MQCAGDWAKRGPAGELLMLSGARWMPIGMCRNGDQIEFFSAMLYCGRGQPMMKCLPGFTDKK